MGGSCKGNKCAFIHDLGRLLYDYIMVRLIVLDVYNYTVLMVHIMIEVTVALCCLLWSTLS